MKIYLPSKADLGSRSREYDPVNIPGATPVPYWTEECVYSEDGVEPENWHKVGIDHRQESHWDNVNHPTAISFYRKERAFKYYVEMDTLDELVALITQHFPSKMFFYFPAVSVREDGDLDIFDVGDYS